MFEYYVGVMSSEQVLQDLSVMSERENFRVVGDDREGGVVIKNDQLRLIVVKTTRFHHNLFWTTTNTEWKLSDADGIQEWVVGSGRCIVTF